MAAAIVIALSNAIVAVAAAVVAVTAGGVWYALALPVVVICGAGAVWQIAVVARANRRRST